MSKGPDIYHKHIELEYTCTNISIEKWNSLMMGAVKANGRKIRQMIKCQLTELFNNLALQFPNPYEQSCMRTATHLIYVHSSVEYFLKVS